MGIEASHTLPNATRECRVMLERREHLRLQYAPAERPTVSMQGRTFQVFEMSERGLRFKTDLAMVFAQGMTFGLTLTFYEGNIVNVPGTIIRVQHTCVGIRLLGTVPLESIRTVEALIKRRCAAGV